VLCIKIPGPTSETDDDVEDEDLEDDVEEDEKDSYEEEEMCGMSKGMMGSSAGHILQEAFVEGFRIVLTGFFSLGSVTETAGLVESEAKADAEAEAVKGAEA
jgi:hypothetical protein